MFSFNISKPMVKPVVLAQQPTSMPQIQQPTPSPYAVDAIAVMLGLLGGLGIPKLLQMFGVAKVQAIQGERRKEDAITKAALDNNGLVLNSLIEINRLTVGLLSSGKEEQWQTIATLINELREERLDRQQRNEVFERFLQNQTKMLENQELLHHTVDRIESFIEQKTAPTRQTG